MFIMYEAQHSLTSLNSPLQTLIFDCSVSDLVVVNKTSLQILQKWNASLEYLFLFIGPLRTVRLHIYLDI